MTWFSNLKLAMKLIISFSFIACISALIGYFGIVNVKVIDERDTFMYGNCVISLQIIANIEADFEKSGGEAKDIAFNPDLAKKEKSLGRMKETMVAIENNLSKYEKTITSDEDRRRFNEVKKQDETLHKIETSFIQEAESKNYAACAEIFSNQIDPIRQGYRKAVQELADFNVNNAKSVSDENTRIADNATMWMIILSVFSVIAALAFGYFIARMISKPVILISERVKQLKGLCVTNLGSGLEALSHGDTTYDVVTGTPFLEITTQDEIGDLARDVDGIITQTRASVSAFEKSRQTVNELISEAGILTQAAL
ncbi:MAG TPA: MCP four helix bundle domain-containing protein, partial [Bacteroidota bacterium]|nr:MCP four helix bundle domain-containing protein [Bacteroidota bacterium]